MFAFNKKIGELVLGKKGKDAITPKGKKQTSVSIANVWEQIIVPKPVPLL